MNRKVIIIGGGIAGLTAAYQLKKRGVNALLLESSDRLGGRIFTKVKDDVKFELGATWVFEDIYLKALIQELELKLYPQYLKGDALLKYGPSMAIKKSPTQALMNGAIYHKIEGGTQAIIDALASQLDSGQIRLNAKVIALDTVVDSIQVKLSDGSILETDQVILAMPPKAVSENIKLKPSIDPELVMQSTQTWMGESAKFTVLFDRDYWRLRNLSGFVYSNYGLIREMQDHQSPDGKTFGLVGFMQAGGDMSLNFEKRKAAILLELVELFGISEDNILGYDDFLWANHFKDESGKNYNADLVPHQNNGHSIYSEAHFGGNLVFAGAETSRSNPGYMEGAVRSADEAIQLLGL